MVEEFLSFSIWQYPPHIFPFGSQRGCVWMQRMIIVFAPRVNWRCCTSDCFQLGRKKKQAQHKSMFAECYDSSSWTGVIRIYMETKTESANTTPCFAVCPLASRPSGEGWLGSARLSVLHLVCFPPSFLSWLEDNKNHVAHPAFIYLKCLVQ